MKHIKLIFTILTVITIYLIYIFSPTDHIIYIALGDSFALGENPYGEIAYGYSDYIANYLDKSYHLKLYSKRFANVDARIKDVKQDIILNKKVYIDERSIGLKSILRESNIITLSIGINDLINSINTTSKVMIEKRSDEIIEGIGKNLEELLEEIKKYNKKIVLVGYYNIYPKEENYSHLLKKLDEKYKKISTKEKITYISTYETFPTEKYLPNPFDIHPSVEGYEYIYHRIISNLEY